MIDRAGRFGYARDFVANTTNYPTEIYPFGFDPVWFRSDQLLSYTNNFKMKLAVVFAIV
jgi:hypothetical protein